MSYFISENPTSVSIGRQPVDVITSSGTLLRLSRSSFSTSASCDAVIPAYQQVGVTADMIGGKCPEVAQNIRLEYPTVLSIDLRRLTDTEHFSSFSPCSSESRVLTVDYGQTPTTGNCTAIELYIAGKAVCLLCLPTPLVQVWLILSWISAFELFTFWVYLHLYTVCMHVLY